LTVQVAVIGPGDLVDKAYSLHREYPSLRLQRWGYEHEGEAPAIYQKASEGIDVALFMGPVPYYKTLHAAKVTHPLVFVSLSGTSLMKAMYKASVLDSRKVNSFSIDILQRDVVLESLEELGEKKTKVYTKKLSKEVLAEDLIEFHAGLWEEGQIDVAMSCLRTAYLELQNLEIPSYRVTATCSAIREALNYAVVRGEQLNSAETQIAVQICKLDESSIPLQESKTEYEGERIRLKLQRILNDYTEETWASMYYDGGNRFSIYTTRGILSKSMNSYQEDPILNKVRESLGVTVSVGTGLSTTAYHAELNAKRALARAEHHGGNCSYVLTTNGRLIGPIGTERSLESTVIHDTDEYDDVIKKTGLGIETISKIVSSLKFLGKDSCTSSELANAMQVSQRSARRYLKILHDNGFAELRGKEHTNPTGRPRKIYRLVLEKES